MREANVTRYRAAGLLIAIAVNLALLGLYLWSRGGQTSILQIESRGGAYRALLDGTPIVPGVAYEGPKLLPLDAPVSGTVLITLPRPAPSLPRPSGIDSIVITNPDLTELYFEDKFEGLNLEAWEVVSGSFDVKDGVLFATGKDGPNTLMLKSRGWTDSSVKLKLRNTMSGVLGTHVVPGGGVYYNFELVRDFPNFFDVVKDGQTNAVPFGGFPHASERGTFGSMGAMLTESYPYILLGLLLGLVATFVLAEAGASAGRYLPPARIRSDMRRLAWPAVLVLAAGAFGVTFFIHRNYYGAIPHLPDEVAYIFQAKLLASGRVMGDIPPVKEAFYFYSPPFLYERGEHWSSFYPLGQPLMLAVGVLFGAVNVVPSLVGAACVSAIYAVGRRMFDVRTGLLAAVLLATSPFFLMQSSNFMSHNTAALYILLSLVFILKREHPLRYGLIAGICFGLAFNTRPLSAVALIPPYAFLLLSYLQARETRRDGIRHIAAFIVGGGLMGLAYLAYNYGLTGDPMKSPYAGNEGATFGFVNGHTFDVGVRNEQAQLMALGLVFNNWPGFAAFALILLPFVLGTRHRWDYFCLASAFIPMLSYTFYRFSGLYEGPRYWYEVAPFLFLLAARGADSAATFLKGVADDIRWRLKRPTRAPLWAAALPIYLLIAIFIIKGSGGWLFGWNDSWSDYEAHLVPNTAAAVAPVFEVDNRLDLLARKTKLDNALVLVKPCGFFAGVHCYGTVFLRNNLEFDGNVVWARFIPERNAEIIAAFPGRDVYIANWDGKASLDLYQAAPPAKR